MYTGFPSAYAFMIAICSLMFCSGMTFSYLVHKTISITRARIRGTTHVNSTPIHIHTIFNTKLKAQVITTYATRSRNADAIASSVVILSCCPFSIRNEIIGLLDIKHQM
jgi:hypothetical protein